MNRSTSWAFDNRAKVMIYFFSWVRSDCVDCVNQVLSVNKVCHIQVVIHGGRRCNDRALRLPGCFWSSATLNVSADQWHLSTVHTGGTVNL